MLGFYTITKILHEDTAVMLCRGVYQRDGTPVVIKTPRSKAPAGLDVERLHHEYDITRQLNSPYLLKPIKLETHKTRLLLIFEDFAGELLSGQLGRPLAVAGFLDIAVQLAAALADIHRQGLVHKNLKPANILIQPHTGQVKLTDFGLAAPLVHVPVSPSSSSLIEGSLAYMSPEQTGRINRGIDHRSDLYSLGVTFYEMLTGVLPFQATDPLEWVHCHIARQPKSPREIVPAIPVPIAAIVMKLLAKQADKRYQSALGLQHDLQHCREQWAAGGQIKLFPLGQDDVSDLFLIPPKLYGREKQVAMLLSAFEQVATTGQSTFMLVSGYAGIGKSSLVRELHQPIVRVRGFFLAGKFDQYQQDIPYATIARAFHDLIQQILTESEDRIQRWKEALHQALGLNGQLIVDIIPHVELIIGPQPPAPELSPTEAQNRFHMVFHKFIGVFARPEHPLALFLDDLQWLDLASLKLIAYLITHPDTRYLFLLGAYRDNEVSPAHPLPRTLDEIRQRNVLVQEISLGPLSPAHVEQLVAETVHRPIKAVAPLAGLVYTKTAGNPFFALQFLTTLYQKSLLEYDDRDASWQWDLAAIRRQDFTDNVVELMIAKLKRCSTATQMALTQAACLGNTAEVHTLALVCDRSEAQLHADLWEAVDKGLLLRLNDSYKFLHDRIQEAAYALIPTEKRDELHLRIGRLWHAQLVKEAVMEHVFDIVNQLNLGSDLITDPGEKESLCQLNCLAGRKAKTATAYASARNYLVQATNLLPADTWREHYEETFALYLDLAECESLAGHFQRADELFNLLLDQARSNLDNAKAYRLRIRLYQTAGRYNDAVTAVFEVLRLFGVIFPESEEDIPATLEAEMQAIQANLGSRGIADLVDAPLAGDPNIAMIITLLIEALSIVYIVRPAYFPLLPAKGVNLSLQHGNTPESCAAYVAYATVLLLLRADIPTALEFSELALYLNEKLNERRQRGVILLAHGLMHNIWRRHFATSVPIMERAFMACLEAGDLVQGNYLAMTASWIVLEKGDPLDEVLRVSQRYAAFAQESHNELIYEVVRCEQQFVACLQGVTRTPASFDDNTFNEAFSFAKITAAAFDIGLAIYHIMKQIAAFIYGDYRAALESATLATPLLRTVAAMPIEAAYHFYHALTLATLYSQAPAVQQREFAQPLETTLQRLKFWADHCPENFLNRYALVAAEIARLEGRDLEAMRLYEQAIRAANENGFVQNEALAYELASNFYRERDFDSFADTYLREARAGYARWGADGKVQQLDQRYPHLVETQPPTPTATFTGRTEQFDLLAVSKASQAISREILLPNLQETLMRLVLAHAGAQRGCLLLLEGESLTIHAQAEIEGEQTRVEVTPTLPVSAAKLPMSLLNYVKRTGEAVVLADAAADDHYGVDEYIVRQQPRSVLCLPIMRQAQLGGLLYLENNLTANAFTHHTLTGLELLASQAAVSLENARLYANLQQENTERRQAEESLQQAEAKYRSIFEHAGEGIFRTTPAGRIIMANPALARMLGYESPADLTAAITNVQTQQYVNPERRTELRRILKEQGSIQQFEAQFYRKDGRQIWLSSNIRAVRDDQGQVLYYEGMSTDITDRKRAEAALQESERSLKEAQRLARVGSWEWNMETDTFALSDELKRITGRDRTLARPQSPDQVDLYSPKDLARLNQAVRNALETGEPYELDLELRRSDGSVRWITERGEAKRAADGRIIGLRGTMQDITERKRAEDALRETERKLRTLVDHIPDCIARFDANCRHLFVNPAVTKTFGASPEHFVGKTLSEIGKPGMDSQNKELESMIQQVFEEGVANAIEAQWLTREGIRFFDIMHVPEQDESGQVVSVLGLAHDITKRRQAESELRASEARFRTFVDHATDAFFLHDDEGTILDVNRQACESLGYTRAELIGMTPPEFDADIAPSFLDQIRARLEVDEVVAFDSRHRRKDGIVFPVEVRIRPFWEGERRFAVSLVRDITDRKRAEEELRKYREHLEELVTARTAELAMAKEKAETANQAKSAFLANMSHELRTPLNAILGYAQILKQRAEPQSRLSEGAQTIHQSGQHLLTLINDILDLSKVEAGKLELHPIAFHLPIFLANIAAIIQARAEAKGLSFWLDQDETLPTWVEADETRLRQVLLNLLGNAVKFTTAGQVTLRVESKIKNPRLPRPYALVRFEVTDTGPGIPPGELERIFQPFEQVGEVARHTEGTGLGLAINRQLVQLMGSNLQVESEPGRGSTFWFEVPLPTAALAIEPRTITQPSTQVIVGYKGRRRKVLVADDIPSNRAVLLDLLQPLGFEVVEAANGQEAVQLAQETRPDFILLDRRMPGLNGLEAAQQLRRIPALQRVPLISISASVTEADQTLIWEVGYDAFLPKPVHWLRLAALLEEYLHLEWRYAEEQVQEFRPSSFIFDPSQVPPLAELVALYELARMGNMRRIRNQAAYLETLGEQFIPFARKLKELAQGYQEKALLALVEQYLERGGEE